jgi:hypothetical protein
MRNHITIDSRVYAKKNKNRFLGISGAKYF